VECVADGIVDGGFGETAGEKVDTVYVTGGGARAAFGEDLLRSYRHEVRAYDLVSRVVLVILLKLGSFCRNYFLLKLGLLKAVLLKLRWMKLGRRGTVIANLAFRTS
jgi:hypothetical protein